MKKLIDSIIFNIKNHYILSITLKDFSEKEIIYLLNILSSNKIYYNYNKRTKILNMTCFYDLSLKLNLYDSTLLYYRNNLIEVI